MANLLRHKKLAAFITALITVLVISFCGMSSAAAKTNRMTSKVKTDLETGILVVERDAPRILVTNDDGYYVPDINAELPGHPPSWSKVYDILLENLNQDMNVPLCKVTKVTLQDGVSEIEAYATIQFNIFPGITKTMTVTKSMPMPHFKNSTGDVILIET